MKTRDILFLLAPSVLFVAVSALSFHFSNSPIVSPPNEENFTKLTEKVERGEVARDDVMALLKSHHEADVSYYNSQVAWENTSRVQAWLLLLGVALQVYAVLRLVMGRRGAEALHATAATPST